MKTTKNKSILEIIITPLLLSITGILGTWMITQEQIASAEYLRSAQIKSTILLTKSDQEIKIIEVFSEKITSESKKDRLTAVNILSVLNPELADKLSSAIAENQFEDQAVRMKAKKNRSTYRTLYYYYVVVSSTHDREDALRFANQLQDSQTNLHVHVFLTEAGLYAVCLGKSESKTSAETLLSTVKGLEIANDAYIKIFSKTTENIF